METEAAYRGGRRGGGWEEERDGMKIWGLTRELKMSKVGLRYFNESLLKKSI